MSRNNTWRDKLRPRIIQVIEENQGKPEKEIRKALRAAYPFPRKYGPAHQYKIWLDEIKVQLGQKPAIKPTSTTKGGAMTRKKKTVYPHSITIEGIKFNYAFGASYAIIETAEGQLPHLNWAPLLRTNEPHMDVKHSIETMLSQVLGKKGQ